MDQLPHGEWSVFALGVMVGAVVGSVSWWLWLLTTRLAGV